MTHKTLVFRPAAEQELSDLYAYIAETSASHDVAFQFTERLRVACLSLETFSDRGTLREDIIRGLRILVHERKTVICYFVREDFVEITNIFHGGQDWVAALSGKAP